jgi:uncharacterized membrane protein
LNIEFNALAMMRFGGGRVGGLFDVLVLLAVVGAIAWALTRSNPRERPKS